MRQARRALTVQCRCRAVLAAPMGVGVSGRDTAGRAARLGQGAPSRHRYWAEKRDPPRGQRLHRHRQRAAAAGPRRGGMDSRHSRLSYIRAHGNARDAMA